jgi:hypothetical protein
MEISLAIEKNSIFMQAGLVAPADGAGEGNATIDQAMQDKVLAVARAGMTVPKPSVSSAWRWACTTCPA